MQTIIVDQRERSSGIVKELIKKDIKIEIRQLVIADFVIQTKDSESKIIDVGIERKTTNDFLNSIIDKRLITQLIALKENFQLPLLIIEGSENIYSLRNFHPNSIRGMLASIAIDFQIPILFTRNIKDTAALLAIIVQRLEKPIKNISLLKKRKPLTLKERQEYLIESLPGIGPTLSKSLLKRFKTVKRVINAKENRLIKTKKLGPKKIEEIKKVVESEYIP